MTVTATAAIYGIWLPANEDTGESAGFLAPQFDSNGIAWWHKRAEAEEARRNWFEEGEVREVPVALRKKCHMRGQGA